MYKKFIVNIIIVMSVIFTVSAANSNIFEKNFLEMQKSEKEFLHMLEVEKEKREKKRLLEKKLKEELERAEKKEQERLAKEKRDIKEAREKYEKKLEAYLVRKEKEREVKVKVKEEEKKRKKELARKYIVAKIDISKQRMTVYRGGEHLYTWKVSTGKNGYHTPTGEYRPIYITRMHYSKKYYNSPMPYSIFFKGGYAIHGTRSVSRLGSRASHGCVRLLTSNAKKFYKLVRKFGKYNIKIHIVN